MYARISQETFGILKDHEQLIEIKHSAEIFEHGFKLKYPLKLSLIRHGYNKAVSKLNL
jgi:hypothetical protein